MGRSEFSPTWPGSDGIGIVTPGYPAYNIRADGKTAKAWCLNEGHFITGARYRLTWTGQCRYNKAAYLTPSDSRRTACHAIYLMAYSSREAITLCVDHVVITSFLLHKERQVLWPHPPDVVMIHFKCILKGFFLCLVRSTYFDKYSRRNYYHLWKMWRVKEFSRHLSQVLMAGIIIFLAKANLGEMVICFIAETNFSGCLFQDIRGKQVYWDKRHYPVTAITTHLF